MNIPTAELGALAEQTQTGPQMLRYPRDPSLDPQLVWKGKDEQDGEDLVVPAIPIHIQEQISPKAIIEDLRAASAGRREQQLDDCRAVIRVRRELDWEYLECYAEGLGLGSLLAAVR